MNQGDLDALQGIRRNWLLALLASLTLGLAPFLPEPHIVGKIRWIWGGGNGMLPMDYFDFVLHSTPWIVLIYYTVRYVQYVSQDTGLS